MRTEETGSQNRKETTMIGIDNLYSIIGNRDDEIDRIYKEAERKIREAAKEMSTEAIIEALTEINDYDDEDIGNLLQDELEARDKEAFDAWHDEQCPPAWEHLPEFFLNKGTNSGVPGGRYWEPEDDRTDEELMAAAEENGYNYEGMEIPFE